MWLFSFDTIPKLNWLKYIGIGNLINKLYVLYNIKTHWSWGLPWW